MIDNDLAQAIVTLVSYILSIITDKFFVATQNRYVVAFFEKLGDFHVPFMGRIAEALKRDNTIKTQGIVSCLAYIPTAVTIILLAFHTSYVEVIMGIMKSFPKAILVLLIVAVMPTVFGVFIDAPCAWRQYCKEHNTKIEKLTDEDKMRIASYGGKIYQQEKGRYNMDWSHIVYATFCNVSGMFCTLSLLYYANCQFGQFSSFVGAFPFLEAIMNLFFSIGMLVTLLHILEEQRIEIDWDEMRKGHHMVENPDTYMMNRCHVLANSFHLVTTLALCFGMATFIVVSSVLGFRKMKLDWSIIFVCITPILFMWYSSRSKMAKYYKAVGEGNWWDGPPIFIAILLVYSFGFFKFSLVSFLVFLLCAALFASWLIDKPNMRKEKNSSSFFIIWMTILSLLVVAVLVLNSI